MSKIKLSEKLYQKVLIHIHILDQIYEQTKASKMPDKDKEIILKNQESNRELLEELQKLIK